MPNAFHGTFVHFRGVPCWVVNPHHLQTSGVAPPWVVWCIEFAFGTCVEGSTLAREWNAGFVVFVLTEKIRFRGCMTFMAENGLLLGFFGSFENHPQPRASEQVSTRKPMKQPSHEVIELSHRPTKPTDFTKDYDLQRPPSKMPGAKELRRFRTGAGAKVNTLRRKEKTRETLGVLGGKRTVFGATILVNQGIFLLILGNYVGFRIFLESLEFCFVSYNLCLKCGGGSIRKGGISRNRLPYTWRQGGGCLESRCLVAGRNPAMERWSTIHLVFVVFVGTKSPRSWF